MQTRNRTSTQIALHLWSIKEIKCTKSLPCGVQHP